MIDASRLVSRGERIQAIMPLLLVPWTVFLAWLYVTAVPGGMPFLAVFRHPLLSLAAIVGITLPAGLCWFLEVVRGRPAARSALLLIVGALVGYLLVSSRLVLPAGAVAVLLAAAYGFGAVASRWMVLVESRDEWRDVPLQITVGLILLILFGIAAGVTGWLRRPVIGAICLVGMALAALPARDLFMARAPAGTSHRDEPAIAWWWGVALLILIGLVGAVAPEVRSDALTAHLPVAREFATQGAIVEMRQNIGSYFQMNGAVLYAMGMLLVPGEAVPKLLHYSAGVLAIFLVYELGRELWDTRVGLVGAAMTAGVPLIWWVGGTAYTDLWVVLFATAAFVVLARFAGGSPKKGAALGLLMGTVMGFKLTGIVVAAPVTVAAFLLSNPSSRGAKGRWLTLGAFIFGALLASVYWYARAWVLTGDPVFPLLNAIFQSPYFPTENTRLNQGLFGMGTGLWDLVSLPWRLTRFPHRFGEVGTIGVVYLALLPVAPLAIVRGQIPRWVWSLGLACGLLWFFSAQYLRYLLPVLPLAALIAAAGLVGSVSPQQASTPITLVLALAIGIPAGAWMASGPPNFPLDVASAAISRQDYVANYIRGFPVIEFVRRSLPRSARIYGAGEDRAFYYEQYLLPGSWYGWAFSLALAQQVLQVRTGSEVQATLTPDGFTHLVVFREDPVVARWRRPDGWLASEALWEEGPRLEYAYAEYYLFDLAPSSNPRRSRGPELLRNAAMERGDTAAPAGWERSGDVAFVAKEAGSPNGRIRLGRKAYVRQQAAVAPDALYVLEAEMASVDPQARARLFFEWMDQRGQTLDYTTWRQMAIGPKFKRYAMACAAPAKARTVRVWLMAMEGDAVEFTNAHLYQLR